MSLSRPKLPIVVRLILNEDVAEAPAIDPASGRKSSGLSAPAHGEADEEDLRLICLPGTLAQTIYLSGLFAPPALCSGLAACGRCRVRIHSDPKPAPLPEDARLFSAEDIALGWRLACKHRAEPGMRLELPGEIEFFSACLLENSKGGTAITPPAALSDSPELRAGQRRRPVPGAAAAASAAAQRGGTCAGGTPDSGKTASLAVDLGTTSMEWRLQAILPQGLHTLWQGKAVNPQMGAGSDLVSRLSCAADNEGRKRLSTLTQNALRRLVEQGTAVLRAGGLSGELSAICLAANTAMTAITLGLDTRSLACAPYSLPYRGGRWELLPGLPRIWTPPQPAPFIGGDIAAGYASLALAEDRPAPEYPFLLADLGTNGELLLALAPDESLAASVALGPALEGIGLSHGTDARPGAVSDFFLSPGGLKSSRIAAGATDAKAPVQSLAEERAGLFPVPGITGTGYLSLLHILLVSGAMDRQGHFTSGKPGALKSYFTPVRADAASTDCDCLLLPLGLRLTARDVEEVLKVKAAFSLGLRCLLDKAGLASRELTRVYIAGALGSQVNKRALEELGFFPQGMEKRLEAVGNSSLDGAALLLRHASLRQAVIRWAATVRTLDLASDPLFMRDFAAHMQFAW
jgi:uncharacterized 2Fe-2S/4Fe-4S cluster protein (DUF4445 family)